MAQLTNLVQGKFLTGVSSVVGDTRRKYEDRAKFIEIRTAKGLDLVVAIIADGVGSADNGGLAAQLSIDSVVNYITGTEETDIALLITNAIKYANFVVYRDVLTRDVDASTTLTVGVIYKERFYVGNVGDSRAYWIQEGGKVIQLTRDHSYYNLKGGDPKSPQAETLVNAIGIQKEVFADVGLYVKETDMKQAAKIGAQGLPLKVGDTILLCSDGLIKDDLKGERFVREEEIVHSIQTEVQPNAAALKMTGLAEGRYVDDNVSVITIQYTTPDRVENVLAKQNRKLRVQKLVYVGLGVLVLAGIVVGAIMANNNRKSEQQLADLRNQPTQTGVFFTPQATPTPTAQVIVAAEFVQALSMGGYDTGVYSEYSYGGVDNPTWGDLDPGSTSELIVPGTEKKANLRVNTNRNVGAMFSLGSKHLGGESLGNNQLYVYGDSSLTLKNDQGITDITLTQGAVYINLVGPSEITHIKMPSHGDVSAELIGGELLLELKPDTVTMWCLREQCSLNYGNEYKRLSAPEVRVYKIGEGVLLDGEQIIPPGERYDEYYLWNLKCNHCLPFEKIYTPTPTSIIGTPTPTLAPGETRNTPTRTATAIPPTRTPTTPPPTWTPTTIPSNTPTATTLVTTIPTETQTTPPTDIPTNTPTSTPTSLPTYHPTSTPTSLPTYPPTPTPMSLPTYPPTTIIPDPPTSTPTSDIPRPPGNG